MLKQIKSLTNTENKKRLISNFMSLSVLRGFQFLISLITLPYLVRTIGIEKFGLVNFALSLGLYFGAIIKFGFGITATREIARHRDDPIKLSQTYSATLTASILLSVVSAVLFVLIVLSFNKFNSYLNLYLFTLAFVVFQSLFPVWFFQGMEKMKYIAFLTLGTSVVFLVALFIFVKQQDDFVIVPLLHAISAMITLLFSFLLINKQFNVRFINPKWQDVKSIYKEGTHAFISQVMPNLYNNSALFLLGIFSNNTSVGLYTAATKVIDAIISFGYILSNTFLPYLSRDLSKHKIFQKIMLTSGSILTFLTLVFAEIITRFLFNSDNLNISFYIQLLALSVLFAFVFLTYNTNYLMISGYDKIAKNIALYVSVIAFFISVVLIYFYHIYGAIIAILSARFMMSLFSFYFYKKRCER